MQISAYKYTFYIHTSTCNKYLRAHMVKYINVHTGSTYTGTRHSIVYAGTWYGLHPVGEWNFLSHLASSLSGWNDLHKPVAIRLPLLTTGLVSSRNSKNECTQINANDRNPITGGSCLHIVYLVQSVYNHPVVVYHFQFLSQCYICHSYVLYCTV